MMGFKIISEMTREELIDEIIHTRRDELLIVETAKLKALIVTIRVKANQEALVKEAGLAIRDGGVFGAYIADNDD